MRQIETIARQATFCEHCFTDLGLTRPSADDLAQPRWIGKDYWSSPERVAVVLLNPGEGKQVAQSVHKQRRELIRAFREERATLTEIFHFQREDMKTWGMPRGAFADYLENRLLLSFRDIALLNLAWCATKGDEHPARMLKACFEKHTRGMLQALAPNAVLLCGVDAKPFRLPVSQAVPDAEVFPVWHYSYWGTAEAADKANSAWLNWRRMRA